MIRITDVVKHLLIINVIVFLGSMFILADSRILSLYYPASEYFKPFQLISHMFMHADTSHLLFNMLTLFFLGPMIESFWGSKRFLFYYLFAGFGAMFVHLLIWYFQLSGLSAIEFQMAMQSPNFRVLGASGAIYGILIAFAMLFPDTRLMLLFPPIPIKAKYLALGLIAIDLFFGVSGRQTGIAHFAHLGGALFGFLLIMYWRKFGTKL
jgi:membrane associated rhomboid family serine protease